jgi:integrase
MALRALAKVSAALRTIEWLGSQDRGSSRFQAEDVQGSVIRVRYSLWRGQLYSPKTEAGKREVDLHSSLAERLQEHLGKRKSGFVFRTSAGTAFGRSNVLRRGLHPLLVGMGKPKCGFHAFRRFRETYLRNKTECPDGLRQFWMGYAGNSMDDLYDKIREDVQLRQQMAEHVGLGYKLPEFVVPVVPRTQSAELAPTA